MIVLISGAKKNVGDFLIVDRAYKLLRTYVDDEITILNRFEDLTDKLNLLNKAKAVVLGGGPAYSPDVFPNIYPFFRFYEKITSPIYPMGIGWNGKSFNNPDEFQFTDTSLQYLKKVHDKIDNSSCRDVITESILHKAGIGNVVMTGCPVWYNIPMIGKELNKKPVNKIVITTGAHQNLIFQTLSLIKQIRLMFRKSEIFLTYHRGILPGKETPPRKGMAYTAIAILAKKYGVKVKDVSGSVEKLDFYQHCDLHIGYRVHAHLHFLSNRKPSVLINEDGRGIGMNKSLKLPLFNYSDPHVIEDIMSQLSNYQEERFSAFNNTFAFIDENFKKMKEFLNGMKK